MMLLNTLMYAGIVNSLLFITTLYERKNIGYGKENLSLSWNIVFIVSGVVNIAFLVFFYLSKNTWKLPAANNIEFELFRIVFFILALPALTWLLFKKSYIGFSFGGIAIIVFIVTIISLVTTAKKVNMNIGTTIEDNVKIIDPDYFDKENRGVLLLSCDTNSYQAIIFEIKIDDKIYYTHTDKKKPFTAIVLPEGNGSLNLEMKFNEYTKGKNNKFCKSYPLKNGSDEFAYRPKYGAMKTIIGYDRYYSGYPMTISLNIDANKLNYMGNLSNAGYSPFYDKSSEFFILSCPCEDEFLLKIINAWGNRFIQKDINPL